MRLDNKELEKIELEDLMKDALAPKAAPNAELNGRILDEWERCRQNKKILRGNFMRNKGLVSAAAAAVCILAISGTAAAAVKHLSREEIVLELGTDEAKNAFDTGNALEINQTAEAGAYRVTLYAVATSEELSESGMEEAAKGGGTYAVVSIERTDGVGMEEDDTDFFVSPLIQGLAPWEYNIASMGGGYSEMVKNGVLYRIIGCDDIALFADRQLYLCVTDTTFYHKEAYVYDEVTGTLARNERYEGVNLLFDLALDPSRADEEKAQEYLSALEESWK